MEVLVAETFSAVVAAEMAEILAIVEQNQTPTTRLSSLVQTLVEGSRDDVTVVWLDGWSMGRRSAALADAVRIQMDAWQEFVLSVIAEGQAAGDFTTDDPEAVAWHLLGMVDGLNAQGLVSYRDSHARGRLITDALEHALGLASGTLAPAASVALVSSVPSVASATSATASTAG